MIDDKFIFGKNNNSKTNKPLKTKVHHTTTIVSKAKTQDDSTQTKQKIMVEEGVQNDEMYIREREMMQEERRKGEERF